MGSQWLICKSIRLASYNVFKLLHPDHHAVVQELRHMRACAVFVITVDIRHRAGIGSTFIANMLKLSLRSTRVTVPFQQLFFVLKSTAANPQVQKLKEVEESHGARPKPFSEIPGNIIYIHLYAGMSY